MATNDDSSVYLRRVRLRELLPDLENVLIVGVIIGKQRPKKFQDKRSNGELYTAVWNFTLRDSPSEYINVSYWGPSEVVFQANDRFRTGDVVEVVNPRIRLRSLNDPGEQYRPMVTSPYSLMLNEKSNIIQHEGPTEQYTRLLRLTTKPLAGYVTIKDVQYRGASIKELNVDMLAVVKSIAPVRTVKARTSETLQVRTIEVFDQTSTGMKVEVWESDIIARSENWKPRLTVLYLADVRVQWSAYQRAFVVKVTSSTIVTENPVGKEAMILLEYAKSAPIEISDIVDNMLVAIPDLSHVQDVGSVRQIHDRINLMALQNAYAAKQFTILTYAYVSALDLDGLNGVLLIKCARCKTQIKGLRCENQECPTNFENEDLELNISFDIKVDLMDHSGTLVGCTFPNQVAEKALGCTANDFMNMSDDEKYMLKFKYLSRRCKVYITVAYVGGRKPAIITIVDISVANPKEIAQFATV